MLRGLPSTTDASYRQHLPPAVRSSAVWGEANVCSATTGNKGLSSALSFMHSSEAKFTKTQACRHGC